MIGKTYIYHLIGILLLCFMQAAGIIAYGQERPRAASKRAHIATKDSTRTVRPLNVAPSDSLLNLNEMTADSIAEENSKHLQELTESPELKNNVSSTDSLSHELNRKQWVPNPTTATWLALVIPGGGQIYNRKYWKLPIIYGGFAGCAYALTWNGKMYKDYQAAYVDAVNENWNATSITDLLPPGYLDRVGKTQVTETLRRRKDTYRRWRDLSIFATIGVYLISIIDAYVDAELSNFDITPDLSMKVEPTIINNRPNDVFKTTNSLNDTSVGLQCSFRF